MSDSIDHRDHYRQVLKAVYTGEVQAFLEAMTDDYVTHTPGRSPISGDFHGDEHVTVHMKQIGERVGPTFRVRPMGDMLIGHEFGLVPVRVTAERDGKVLDTTAFGIWRFENGKVAEHWEMNYDQYMFDEFFSDELADG